jgi:hypothetical protein
MSLNRRILALELAHTRRLAADAGAEFGFSADEILDETIDFLQRPRAQQHRDCPGYTEAELDWLVSRLPLYRRARSERGKRRP